MTDYYKLTDRELDALVAERVMGWEVGGFGDFRSYRQQSGAATIVGLIPRFATNDNAARLVRNRIAELGLTKEYMVGIAQEVWPVGTPASDFKGADDFAFRMHNATPRQQCIAALRAVEGS